MQSTTVDRLWNLNTGFHLPLCDQHALDKINLAGGMVFGWHFDNVEDAVVANNAYLINGASGIRIAPVYEGECAICGVKCEASAA